MKKFLHLILLFVGLFVVNSLFAQINTGGTPAVKFGKNTNYKYGIMPANLPSGGTYGGSQAAADAYNAWKTAYVTTCSGGQYRVLFDDNSSTVSEGIGYGMLLSVYAADKALFDGLWAYYQANTNGNVMNWKISGCSGVTGANGATDAELDVAMALTIAAEQWSASSSTYTAAAQKLIKYIQSTEMASDGQTLNGDKWGNQSTCRNPSYFAPGYYRQFANIDAGNATFWNTTAINASNTILNANRNGTSGLVSNWCDNAGTENSCGNTGSGANGYGADACRNPWRTTIDYLWNGPNASSGATGINSRLISFVSGYENQLKGPITTRSDAHPTNGSYINGSYTTLGLPTMTASSAQGSLNKCYSAIASLPNTDVYFNSTMRCLSLFVLTGNFWAPGASGFVFPPTISSAVTDGTGKIITLTANKALTTSTPDKSTFTVYFNGTAQTTSSVSVSGSTITVNLSTAPTPGQTITISYSGTSITSTEAAVLATFTNMTVLNMLAGNETILDDCDDGNDVNNVGGIWFTFNDATDQNKACTKGTTSTITPLSSPANPFKMTAPGYNGSAYAVNATYTLGVGYKPYPSGQTSGACETYTNPSYVGIGTWCNRVQSVTMDWTSGAGVSFWYKGPICAFQVIISEVTDFCFHQINLQAATTWTKVTVKWSDLVQPNWGKAVTFSAAHVQKLQWQFATGNTGTSGSTGSIWIDDVHVLTMPPVAMTSFTIGIDPLSKITNPLTLTTTSKDTLKLQVVPTPTTASYPVASWKSSDTTVVKVDYNGNIKVIGYGTATITAIGKMQQGLSATYTVTVPAPKVNPTSITFNPTTASVVVGQTSLLIPTFAPTGVTETGIKWTSANTAIATVAVDGTVTGVAAGSVVISATSSAVTTIIGKITVTVTKIAVTGITVTPSPLNVVVGTPETLTADIAPANASVKTISWTVDKSAIATVVDGVVTGVSAGTCTITARSTDNATISQKITVTVTLPTVLPTSITLAPATTATLLVGETVTLVPTFDPAGTTDKTVTWTSSSNAIATVLDGVVTAVAAGGPVTITATSKADNTVLGTATITLVKVGVTGITINPSPLDITIGTPKTLTATVAPQNALQTVTWKSDKTSVATVNATTGEVSGVSAGSCIITCTSSDNTAVTQTVNVTVKDANVLPQTISLAPLTTATLLVGSTVTLTPTVLPAGTTDKSVTWSSSSDAIATVSTGGVVTGVAAGGPVTITATSKADKTVIGTATITQVKVAVNGITINPSPLDIIIGTPKTLTATVAPQNAVQTVTWATDKPSVATVDVNSGEVSGVAVGSCTITCTSTDNTAMTKTVNVTVTAPVVLPQTITVAPETTALLLVGANVTLVPTVLPAGATDKTVAWKSSDNTIASVSTDGVVTGVAAGGPVTITATSKADKTILGTATITQVKIAIESILVTPTSAVIVVGKTASATATISPDNATFQNVTWSSSKDAVATVSSKGVITAQSSGYAIITVTCDDNTALFKTITVTCVDKSILATTITDATTLYDASTEGVSDGMYPTGSKTIVQDAIIAATTVNTTATATQAQVDAAITTLNTAVDAFKLKKISIDKSILATTIQTAQSVHDGAVEGLADGQYPTGSKAILLTAIGDASTVNGDKLASQAQVDAAITTLNDAITAFQKKVIGINKGTLAISITNVQTVYAAASEGSADGQYPTGSKATLLSAINAADAINKDPLASQAQVDAAVTTLNDAVTAFQKLKISVSKVALVKAISDAQAVYNGATEGTGNGMYPVGSKTTLQDAIASASLLNKNPLASQDDVDAAIKILNTAVTTFQGLKIIVDKSALVTTIGTAQTVFDNAKEGSADGQYPVGSKITLQSAIDVASAVIADPQASQANVVDAIKTLNDAVTTFNGLKISVDKKVLVSTMSDAQKIHDAATEGTASGEYPSGSKLLLQNAIDAATAVNIDPLVSQVQVDVAIKTLKDSIASFQAKVIGVNKGALIIAIGTAQGIYDGATEGTDNNMYPAGSKTTLLTAIDAAGKINKDASATQAQVDAATTAVNDAVSAFQKLKIVVDKSTLVTAIGTAQGVYDGATEGTGNGMYPTGSKTTLLSAIATATTVNKDAKASQAQVDAAIKTVNDAVAAFQLLKITIDKSALVTAIGDAQSIYTNAKEGSADGQYPANSRATLQLAIDAATTVNKDASASQTQVVDAIKALTDAVTTFQGLKISVDKKVLVSTISNAQTTHNAATEGTASGEYPSGSKLILQNAIDAASAVNIDLLVSQVQVDAAIKTLKDSVASFQAKVFGVNKGALVTAINAAKATYSSATEGTGDGMYPTNSKATLQLAINAADAINKDPQATQTQVTDAVKTLNDAVTAFQKLKITVDKSALVTAIGSAQTVYTNAKEGSADGQYPANSRATLQLAIDAATTVNKDASASQTQVVDAIKALTDAVTTFQGLKITVDKKVLVSTIGTAQSLHDGATEGTGNGEYPTGSKLILQDAIGAASVVNKDVTVSQTQVNDAITTLNKAVSDFQAKVLGLDKSKLVITINDAQKLYDTAVEGLGDGQYPVGSRNDLYFALVIATETNDNADAIQSDVDQSVKDLSDAIDLFKAKKITVTTSELATALSDAQKVYNAAVEGVADGQYPIDSKKTLQAGISVASDIKTNPNSSQDEVNQAIVDLQKVVSDFQALKTIVDKSALGTAISNAKDFYDGATEGTTEGLYPAGSKAILQTAITTATTVNTNALATQAQVDQVKIDLLAALAAFKLKVIPPAVISTLIFDAEKDNLTLFNTPWFSFDDSKAKPKAGSSTITPLSTDTIPFTMTAPGVNSSAHAAMMDYSLMGQAVLGYDPFVGMGFGFTNPLAAYDLTGTTGISFWVKSNKDYYIEINLTSITDDCNFNKKLQATSTWTEVTLNWTDFNQYKDWGIKVARDLSLFKQIQFKVQDVDGTAGQLWIDDIRILGKKLTLPVIANKSALVAMITNAQKVYTGAIEGSAEGQYPTGSKAILQTAITAATTVNTTLTITQAAVDQAVIDLQTAITQFQAKSTSVNKDALVTAIASAQNVNDRTIEGSANGQYPIGSKATLQIAINAATNINTNTLVTQAQVDAAITTLQTAVTAFKAKVIVINKTALLALITSAQTTANTAVVGTLDGQYPQSTMTDLQTAITVAQTASSNAGISQAQVDQAVIDLQTAIDIFKAQVNTSLPVDKTALNTKITSASSTFGIAVEGTTTGKYPIGSKAILQTALTTAQAVYTNSSATQAQVNVATINLQTAINQFLAKVITVDKSGLTQTITDAQTILIAAISGTKPGQYPTYAIDALTNAITDAQDVNTSTTSNQTEIDAAQTALTTAISEFELKVVDNPNKATLNTYINSAQLFLSTAVSGTKPTQYPADEYSAFETAINQAVAVYTDPTMSQAEVNIAANAIDAAISKFRGSQYPSAEINELNIKILDAMALYSKSTEGLLPTQYPKAARTTFYAAITKADSIKNTATATQDEVDKQKTALDLAITAFKASVNPGAKKVALSTAIADANSKLVGIRVPKDYPQKAVDSLMYRISIADEINNNPNATQDEVDAETYLLLNSIIDFLMLRNVGFDDVTITTTIGPNPVVNMLTIKSTETITSIDIYSITGIIVKQLKSNSTSIDIDLSDIIAGNYYLKIILSDGSTLLKEISKE